MRNQKAWLAVVFVVAALAGAAVGTGSSPVVSAATTAEPPGDHWQHHDGHWSYWHAGDKRWYYTDGVHWFFNDGKVWQPYRFDREFGKERFERGEYKVPGEGVKIVVPRHEVHHR